VEWAWWRILERGTRCWVFVLAAARRRLRLKRRVVLSLLPEKGRAKVDIAYCFPGAVLEGLHVWNGTEIHVNDGGGGAAITGGALGRRGVDIACRPWRREGERGSHGGYRVYLRPKRYDVMSSYYVHWWEGKTVRKKR
jgi:hypothetical protein